MGRYADGRWAFERWQRTGRLFSVAGRSGSAGSGANDVIGQLWNPHSSRSLWVAELLWTRYQTTAAGNKERLVRTTTRGTPGSTVTPDLDNDFEREQTPDTGAVLDLANFSVEPTLEGAPLARVGFEASLDEGFLVQWIFPGNGVRVSPGTGLAIAVDVALLIQGDLTFRFWE